MDRALYELIQKKKHHMYRRELSVSLDFAGKPPEERMAMRFEKLCEAETPVILPGEEICYLRTISRIPDIFSEAEWQEIRKTKYIHELGYMSNVSPDYESVIRDGLLKRREAADEYGQRAIDAIFGLADRYRDEAVKQGRRDIAKTLERVPRYGATSFREALQFFRILHFSLWLEGNYHITVGRFDQYMFPYLQADMEKGLYTEESALSLLEDFFLSFNRDSDLYPGVQQGDNGQSMVLGGMDSEGNDAFNLLSKLCLQASEDLKMIDPKINLRVSHNTPLEIYEMGTRLTRAGLGFPQYSNDDAVIEGLTDLGYDLQDARDYVVAACWEFIIPKVGADIANIAALSFPKIVDTCLHRKLAVCHTFEDFMAAVRQEIHEECGRICSSIQNVWFIPSPLLRLCMGEIRYRNEGIHGTGIATAADSLYAIQKYVYGHEIEPDAFLDMIDSDFEHHGEWLPKLRYETEKMGNDVDDVDTIAVELLDDFADALAGRKNDRGGIFRGGTGSAMYYLWHADEIGASPDGRRKGEAFGANYSPSLFAKTKGPFSLIKSFVKPNLKRVINGGPLTLEFHSSMFTDEACIQKVAQLVKTYIDLGGHQLQLNAVNADVLRDAQQHPEDHQQLVVRIWGWSAYFVELDKEYQDHVLQRTEYTV